MLLDELDAPQEGEADERAGSIIVELKVPCELGAVTARCTCESCVLSALTELVHTSRAALQAA